MLCVCCCVRVSVQILEAFRLFDTDENGLLDEAEMHAAMFALGYVSDFPQKMRHQHDMLHFQPLNTTAVAPEESSRGIRFEQFREMMQGSIIGRTGVEEIRMTFEVIVSSSPLEDLPVSVALSPLEGNGDLQHRSDTSSQKIRFENLQRACQM